MTESIPPSAQLDAGVDKQILGTPLDWLNLSSAASHIWHLASVARRIQEHQDRGQGIGPTSYLYYARSFPHLRNITFCPLLNEEVHFSKQFRHQLPRRLIGKSCRSPRDSTAFTAMTRKSQHPAQLDLVDCSESIYLYWDNRLLEKSVDW